MRQAPYNYVVHRVLYFDNQTAMLGGTCSTSFNKSLIKLPPLCRVCKREAKPVTDIFILKFIIKISLGRKDLGTCNSSEDDVWMTNKAKLGK